jgi:hypothetical protein
LAKKAAVPCVNLWISDENDHATVVPIGEIVRRAHMIGDHRRTGRFSIEKLN